MADDSLKALDDARQVNIPNLGSIVPKVDDGPDQNTAPELACFDEAQRHNLYGTFETDRSFKQAGEMSE